MFRNIYDDDDEDEDEDDEENINIWNDATKIFFLKKK